MVLWNNCLILLLWNSLTRGFDLCQDQNLSSSHRLWWQNHIRVISYKSTFSAQKRCKLLKHDPLSFWKKTIFFCKTGPSQRWWLTMRWDESKFQWWGGEGDGLRNQSAYPFLSYSLTRGFHVWSSSSIVIITWISSTYSYLQKYQWKLRRNLENSKDEILKLKKR